MLHFKIILQFLFSLNRKYFLNPILLLKCIKYPFSINCHLSWTSAVKQLWPLLRIILYNTFCPEMRWLTKLQSNFMHICSSNNPIILRLQFWMTLFDSLTGRPVRRRDLGLIVWFSVALLHVSFCKKKVFFF